MGVGRVREAGVITLTFKEPLHLLKSKTVFCNETPEGLCHCRLGAHLPNPDSHSAFHHLQQLLSSADRLDPETVLQTLTLLLPQ